jgi:hypothetical protein
VAEGTSHLVAAVVAILLVVAEVTLPAAVADIPPAVIAKVEGCEQRVLLHELM